MQHQTIAVLDYGSQYSQLICRRVREKQVYAELVSWDRADEVLPDMNPDGIILSGGPNSVYETGAPILPQSVLESGVPVLGICYGLQLLAHSLGGQVSPSTEREYGSAEVAVTGHAIDDHVGTDNPLFADLPGTLQVWMSHGDRVEQLPEGFLSIAHSGNSPLAAIADEDRRIYGLQFHPEVVHTPEGGAILENFVKRICGCIGDWTAGNFIHEMVERIQAQVGEDGHVICGLSGGVDSSVAAILIHEAIGDQLTCVFVDHGLLRQNEADEVLTMFRDHYNIPLIHADETELFLGELDGQSDPETKRKIIGRLFIDVFQKHANTIDGAEFLAQGTLYPDVIESVSFSGGPSVTIKSHHNVGGLPEKMGLKLVEPLRELFKDEVRALGRELGLPDSFIGRHPFPGPGLAIRCPGEITREKLEILRKADAVYIDQIRKHGLYDEIWQAFVAILPVRTVGVMGDGRTYDFACALRAVNSVDGMTADYYPFSHDFLGETATRIINEVQGINRVTYDITSKPPGTIEWE